MLTRIQNVLVMIVALFVLGASSQSAVCELSCGLQVQSMGCHAMAAPGAMSMPMATMIHTDRPAAPNSTSSMAMDHSHCHHGTAALPMQAMLHQAAECHDAGCNHATVVAAFDKSGASTVSFGAVQWVAVASLPVALKLSAGNASVVQRPPVSGAAVDPLIVSLRV